MKLINWNVANLLLMVKEMLPRRNSSCALDIRLALKEMDFIEKTHDPATREENDMEANTRWANTAEFKELQILDVELGQEEDSKGYVEFRAQFRQDGKDQSHHERSLFLKKMGSGFFKAKNPELTTFERTQPKVGRNDPCVCGSGKKFKKCCG
ncbi:MAG: YchJ family metal-binding protein [Bdellovibrionales bacterium]